VDDLKDDWRRFTLSADDITALNPNTGTVAAFRSVRDAEITKAIYRRVPVLIKEAPISERGYSPHLRGGDTEGGRAAENPWGIRFTTMFHMSNDSHLFRTRAELESAGFALRGNHFVGPHAKSLSHKARGLPRTQDLPPRPEGEGEGEHILPPRPEGGDEGQHYLPLYEAKMIHQFTHRWASYTPTLNPSPLGRGTLSSPRPEGEGPGGEGLATRNMSLDELRDPSALPLPRYWVDGRDVAARIKDTQWLLGFRDIARSTDERTAIFSVLPRVAVGHVMPLIHFSDFSPNVTCIVAKFDTFIFDYNARQKIGGTHLTYGYLKQLPVIPPHTYTPALLNFITPRVLELTYTAWDLRPFAQDVGYDGAPFIWDEERRFLMRCELDALYFHLYQISRDDVDYIMETFPIVKRKDEAAHGEYRTKRIILEMYDQMAALPTMHAPAPKNPPRPEGEGDLGGEGLYLVPDVSQWVTWLNPPPADPSVAHPDRKEE